MTFENSEMDDVIQKSASRRITNWKLNHLKSQISVDVFYSLPSDLLVSTLTTFIQSSLIFRNIE